MDAGADLGVVQVRAAATSFLRLRPVVVVPTAWLQGYLVWSAPAPALQLRAMGVGLTLTCAAFVVEAALLSRRQVSAAWLRGSLGATLAGLAAACVVSGGARSPLLPLLFAPIVTAFAAFGRDRYTTLLAAASGALLVGLAADAGHPAFPPLPGEAAGKMAVLSAGAALVLSWIAVTGFAGAYARTASALERLRLLSTGEAEERARSVETVGAVVAHELKNPLTAIKGLVQLAARSPATERDGKRLGVVLSEVERMEVTLRDYLAFSRPEASLRAEPIALDRLLDDLAVTLEGRAASSGVTVKRHGAPARVLGDERRLREAVLNLATNAIEAMPRGGALELGVEPTSEGGATIMVADEGPGLPAEALDHPFESGKGGGSGLGLLVALRVARRHGGTLSVHRSASGGALLRLTLPARAGSAATETETARAGEDILSP